jgi:hypothetical protein
MCGHGGRGRRGWFAVGRFCGQASGGHGPRGFAYGFGFGPGDFRAWAGPSREEMLRWLEEYQRDLEQEIMDVQSRIKELRREQGETSA